jgi:hypothetical protein
LTYINSNQAGDSGYFLGRVDVIELPQIDYEGRIYSDRVSGCKLADVLYPVYYYPIGQLEAWSFVHNRGRERAQFSESIRGYSVLKVVE